MNHFLYEHGPGFQFRKGAARSVIPNGLHTWRLASTGFLNRETMSLGDYPNALFASSQMLLLVHEYSVLANMVCLRLRLWAVH